MKRIIMKKCLLLLAAVSLICSGIATDALAEATVTAAAAAASQASSPTAASAPSASQGSSSPAASASSAPAASTAPSPGASPAASAPAASASSATAPANASAAPTSLQAKFDFLKGKGIFDGLDEAGTAGLDKEMTRAQMAKVLAGLTGLKEDKAASAVYTDLDGAGWAAGYIGSVTKATYMNGVSADTFQPSASITVEQVAAVMVRAFKLQSDPNASVSGAVSPWAKDSVAAAIKAGFIASMPDYTLAAKREVAVQAAYEAAQLKPGGSQPPVVTNVSIAELKATGAKTLWMKLNGAIADPSKLTISVFSGGTSGTPVNGTPKWNAAKNEVTVTLNAKMVNGVYTVKLDAAKDSGLTIDKGTADVTAADEKLMKLEFAAPSETVALGRIKIGFKAINQYNEVSDQSAARFTVMTSPELDALPAADSQSVTIDTATAVSTGILDKEGTLTVTVRSFDDTLTVTKSFKLGDEQSVGKIELGDIIYASGKTSLEEGDFASLAYKAYDQYGYPVINLDVLQEYVSTWSTDNGIIDTQITAPLHGFGFVADETGDSLPDLRIKAVDKFDFSTDQEVTFRVVALQTGQTVTKAMKIAVPKIPYDISFGSFTGTIAVGDDDVFIPIVVKDAAGNPLSTDDLVNQADKINIRGSGSSTVTVGVVDSAGTKLIGGMETTGANRGKIRVSSRLRPDNRKGTLTITAMVSTSGKSATWSTNIYEKRYPATVFISVVPKPKMMPSFDMNNGRTENPTRIKFRDQYGEEFYRDYRGYSVQLTMDKAAGSVTDGVYLFKGGFDKTKNLVTSIILNGADGSVDGYKPAEKSITETDIDAYRDKDIIFVSNVGDNNQGIYRMTAKLFKGDRTAVAEGTATLLSTAVSTVQLLKGKEADNLTYTISPFPNGIYAIDKVKGVLQGAASAAVNDPTSTVTKYVYSTEGYALENMFAGKVTLTAKDAGGNIVQLPNNAVKNVAVSNAAVATVVLKTKPDGQVPNTFDGFGIRGKDTGTTNIAVSFQPSNYSGLKFATLDNIAVKEDGLSVASFAATYNGKAKSIWLSSLKAGINIFQGNSTGRLNQNITFSNITMNDQYVSNYFKNSSITRVLPLFGIQVLVSNVRWSSDDIVPGSGYIAVESNSSGVNSVNGLSNAPYPLNGPDAKGVYTYPVTDSAIGATAGAAVDPADWVFSTVNPKVRLNRGDAKYVYMPAKSAVDGSDVEIASFTVTMIAASGKSITVDVYANPANAKY